MGVRKCVICGQVILPTDESVPYKKRHAHIQCFNNMMKIAVSTKQEEKEKKQPSVSKKSKPVTYKDCVSEEEYQEKQEFVKCMKTIMSSERLDPKIYKLAEDYITRYGFTYKGMTQCMDYLIRVLEKELTGDGMGLIPYYYNEAQKHFREVQQTANINNSLTPEQIQNLYSKHLIHITPRKPIIKQISIEEIGCD